MPMESSPDHPQPLRVIVDATKNWVERLGAVWVEGQIIELKRRSGFVQFLTLRDETADVSVTVTTTAAVLDTAGPITEGTVVAAWVKPTVWAVSGRLSFECRDIRPTGEGRLLAAIEQRKRMLQAEGLFARELKRPLPFLPRLIGLVTGAGSAAERDVLENTTRRWPAARFDVRHTLVQGPSAVGQVAEAVAALDAAPEVDVIVIARGGGSLEDLLPFSDETLVRAVAACRTPVVSAIGHDIDRPILDLVADARASTPTEAARLIVPDAAEQAGRIAHARDRLRAAIGASLAAETRRLDALLARPVMRDPAAAVTVHRERVAALRQRGALATQARVRTQAERVGHLLSRVRALSPQATLQRGYAILSTGGATVTSTTQVSVGDAVDARLADGRLQLTVADTVSPARGTPVTAASPSPSSSAAKATPKKPASAKQSAASSAPATRERPVSSRHAASRASDPAHQANSAHSVPDKTSETPPGRSGPARRPSNTANDDSGKPVRRPTSTKADEPGPSISPDAKEQP